MNWRGAAILTLFLLITPFVLSANLPAMPAQVAHTSPPSTSGWPVYTVSTSETIQSEINNAVNSGQNAVVRIACGHQFKENIRLPTKTGNHWTVIEPDCGGLPSFGTRVSPSDKSNMWWNEGPKVGVSGIYAAIQNNGASNHYWIIGGHLTLEHDPNVQRTGQAIARFDSSGATGVSNPQSHANWPSNIYLDRMIIVGNEGVTRIKNAVQWNAINVGVLNSHIEDMYMPQFASKAVGVLSGGGPYLVENNFLESGGINIIFGGAAPPIQGDNPKDATFRRNHFYKDPAWAPLDFNVQLNKNLFETKACVRCLLEENIFENNWAGEQGGKTIPLRSESFGQTTSDVIFRWNHIIDVPAVFDLISIDSGNAVPMARVHVHDNLIEKTGGDSSFANIKNPHKWTITLTHKASGPLKDIVFERNTFDNPKAVRAIQLAAQGGPYPATGIEFKDNVIYPPSGLFKMGGKATGEASINAWSTNPLVVTGNAVVGYNWNDMPSYAANNHQNINSLAAAEAVAGVNRAQLMSKLQGVRQGTGSSSPPPTCNCGGWQSGTCGGGSCSSTQREQTRSCSPNACSSQSQCVTDTTCSSTPPPTGSGLLFHSTLDSFSAVQNPATGDGTGSVQNNVQFVSGRVGNGALFDRGTSYISVPQIAGGHKNIELDTGTMQFWYRPNYNSNDNTKYRIITTSRWDTLGGFGFGKHNNANSGGLYLMHFNGALPGHDETYIAPSQFSWNAGDWIDIVITWDWTSSGQNVHVYFDGQELSQQIMPTGPKALGPESASENIYIGNDGPGIPGTILPADGVIDELKIWDTVIPPGSTPPSSNPEDINNDGEVNILDLILVANCIAGTGGCSGMDFDNSGFVDVLDMILMVNAFT